MLTLGPTHTARASEKQQQKIIDMNASSWLAVCAHLSRSERGEVRVIEKTYFSTPTKTMQFGQPLPLTR
jgi:hypothetical protein